MHQLDGLVRIHSSGWLIKKQYFRMSRQGSRNLQATLCPIRKIGCNFEGTTPEIENLQQAQRILFDLTLFLTQGGRTEDRIQQALFPLCMACLLYTSDAADE